MKNDVRAVALLYILASIALGVAGQLFFKRGMMSLGPLALSLRALPGLVLTLVTRPRLLAGAFLYFLSAVLWLYALSRVDLSYAYPLLALNVVLIPLGARFLFKEPVSRARWGAILLIGCGIAFVTMS